MRIGLLHYSGPPTVGGVERTLYHHSRALAELGHQPRLLVGQGEPFDPRVDVQRIPRLFSGHPEALRVKAQLDAGQVTEDFGQLRASIQEELLQEAAGLQALVVHNVLTLHKNLALTSALHELQSQGRLPRLIGWHHDFAWERPDYRSELHSGDPWDLLRRAWPGVAQVVVSAAQRARLADLYSVAPETIQVIPPGIDPALSGRWTPQARELARRLDLLRADLLLLLPARITRRKNIEFALEVLAALRREGGQDARLLVTGPPGPHNPGNLAYLEQLLQLRRSLGLERSAHFLHADLPEPLRDLSDDTLASLYLLCDALFFPSRDEGFGIPLLEAAYARLPSFCSDIPAFRETGREHVRYFSLNDRPEQVAALLHDSMASDERFLQRRLVLQGHTWERLVAEQLLPLLEGGTDG
jgi:glycosyltransferase involved in cell wall biosynthesis